MCSASLSRCCLNQGALAVRIVGESVCRVSESAGTRKVVGLVYSRKSSECTGPGYFP